MRSAAVLVVALAVIPLAGCGGGGGGDNFGTPPREYAGAICTAVGSWLAKIKDRTAKLQNEGQETIKGDLEKGKGLIVGYLDDLIGYSEDLVSDVEDADKPDVDHGQAIAGEIRTAVERARIGFVDAREEAKNLPTDNPAAFQRETQELGSTLTKEGKAIEEALDGVSERYGANELDQAFENEPSCAQLATQST
jgi:hypothetical protein